MFRSVSVVSVVASLAPVRHTFPSGAKVLIGLPLSDGRLYSIVTFLPLMVHSVVPGGLGRLLLSSGCCPAAQLVKAMISTHSAPNAKLFRSIFRIVLSDRTLLSRG